MLLPLNNNAAPLWTPSKVAVPSFVDPSSLPSLSLWLTAGVGAYSDAGVTLAVNGGSVSQWNDRSSNSCNAETGVAATYQTGIINGKPVIHFGGSQWLVTPAFTLGAFTSTTVFRSTNGMLLEHSTNSNANDGNYEYTPGGANVAVRRSGVVTAYDLSGATLNDNAWKVLTQRFDGTHAGHEVFINGSLVAKGTTYNASDPGAAQSTSQPMYIGVRFTVGLFLAGDVAEMVICNQSLNDTDRSNLETYLKTSYAIA